jgi:hypothetical protein
MNIDTQIENFKNAIVNDINSSGLPLSITELVLSLILKEVTETKNENIAKAQVQSQEEK